MLLLGPILPLAQSIVRAPAASKPGPDWADDPALFVGLVGFLLVAVLVLLLARRRNVVPDFVGQAVLIDGSNVMHWEDNTPRLGPLQQVVQNLSVLGLKPGVVFDANAGYKLQGRYLDEQELAGLLGLPKDQIFVVPSGSQADPYLLETARMLQAQIVTNDRFRDWQTDFPEVTSAGLLISGGVRDGQIWLDGLAPDQAEK